jgi:hypothetical protein
VAGSGSRLVSCSALSVEANFGDAFDPCEHGIGGLAPHPDEFGADDPVTKSLEKVRDDEDCHRGHARRVRSPDFRIHVLRRSAQLIWLHCTSWIESLSSSPFCDPAKFCPRKKLRPAKLFPTSASQSRRKKVRMNRIYTLPFSRPPLDVPTPARSRSSVSPRNSLRGTFIPAAGTRH